jgi:hypothetical protein
MFLRSWGWRTIAIILENVHPTFFSPSDILTKQNVLKGVMKLFFSSSSLHTLIWWKHIQEYKHFTVSSIIHDFVHPFQRKIVLLVSNSIVDPPVMGIIVPKEGKAFGFWVLELDSGLDDLSGGDGNITWIGCGCWIAWIACD